MLDHSASAAYSASPTVTRPANATPYTAGDVVGATAAVWTFTNIGPANDRMTRAEGARIRIDKSVLRITVTSVPAGMSTFRLHLYSASPASAYADNAVWTLHADDVASYLGYIDLGAPALPAAGAAAIFVQTKQDLEPFKLAAGSNTLYGYLVTNGAYTPTSAAVKQITLHAIAA